MDKCFITDINVEFDNDIHDVIGYQLVIDDKFYYFTFSDRTESWIDESEMGDFEAFDGRKVIPIAIKNIKYILRGLVLNKKLSIEHCSVDSNRKIWNIKFLKEIIKYYDYPKTPDEKIDELFYYLFKLQNYDGQKCYLQNLYDEDWKKLYFKNQNEMQFYLETLYELSYIDLGKPSAGGIYTHYNLTHEGLKYVINLTESSRKSNKCFVAMSFNEDDLEEIYKNGIYPVLDELKFEPVLICDEEYESDKTINDAMIAAIKKSKFLIADFTKQKRNVYFESGYAAGRNIPVIYTCKKEYFNDSDDINKMSAFDTNHYPHIIWNDVEDLKLQLKNKIEAKIL